MNKKDTYKRIAEYNDYSIDLAKVYYHKIIKEVLSLCPAGHILDIGCYDGVLGEAFLKKGYKVYGIEAHHEACQKALQKGVEVIKKDIEEGLPWKDNFFDCVIAAEIIEHVYDTDLFIEEIKRVLKPNGILVMSLPNIACFTNRLRLLFGYYPRYGEYQAGKAGGHIRVYNLSVIKEQLSQHGFEIISIKGANFPMPMEKKFIPNFIKKIAIKIGDYTPGIAGQIIIAAHNNKDSSL